MPPIVSELNIENPPIKYNSSATVSVDKEETPWLNSPIPAQCWADTCENMNNVKTYIRYFMDLLFDKFTYKTIVI